VTSRPPAKGWPQSRRARQALNIQRSKPWLRSTGPKTQSGKDRSAANALKHGCRSRAFLEEARAMRALLRAQRAFIDYVRALIRANSKTRTHSLGAMKATVLSALSASMSLARSSFDKPAPRPDLL